MNRFLISCAQEDAASVNTLFAGLSTHSECEAFPFSLEDMDAPPLLFKLLPHLQHLHDTWMVTLYDHDSLETMVKLMESIAWVKQDMLFIVSDTARETYTLAQFHKRVMVDGCYREAV